MSEEIAVETFLPEPPKPKKAMLVTLPLDVYEKRGEGGVRGKKLATVPMCIEITATTPQEAALLFTRLLHEAMLDVAKKAGVVEHSEDAT